MNDRVKHSEPISIPNNNHPHARNRSSSFSASSDDDNSPPLHTPSSSVPPPRVNTANSPSTSPILSYFFHTPAKTNPVVLPSPTTGFGSFARGFSARPHEQPIIEEDEDRDPPLARHVRRMSTSAGWAPAAPRFKPAPPSEQTERAAGLLRRLNLGAAFARPQPPSPPTPHATPVAPIPTAAAPAATDSVSQSVRKKRRATTIGAAGGGGRPRRSPSPMGERILTGHFDGF